MKACCFFQSPKGMVLAKESSSLSSGKSPENRDLERRCLAGEMSSGRISRQRSRRGPCRFPRLLTVGQGQLEGSGVPWDGAAGVSQPGERSERVPKALPGCPRLRADSSSCVKGQRVCLSSCRGAGVESELSPTPGGLSRGDWCRPGSPRTPASASQGQFWLPGEVDGGRGLAWGYGLLAGGCEAAAGLRLEASIVGGWVGCRWPVGPRGFLRPGLFLSRVARWGGAAAGGGRGDLQPPFPKGFRGAAVGVRVCAEGNGPAQAGMLPVLPAFHQRAV